MLGDLQGNSLTDQMHWPALSCHSYANTTRATSQLRYADRWTEACFNLGETKRNTVGKESKVFSKFSVDLLILPYWRRENQKKLLQKLASSYEKFMNTFPPSHSPFWQLQRKNLIDLAQRPWIRVVNGLNYVLPKFIGWSPNPWYLRMWRYLGRT